MITNSKPERCEVCGGTAEKPRLIPCSKHCQKSSQSDKHKRVAECWVNWWLIEGMPIPKAYLTECEALESLFNTGTLIAVAKHEKFQF